MSFEILSMKFFLPLLVVFCIGLNAVGQTSEEFNYRGVAKDELKDYKGAIEEYTKAIAKNPKNAMAFYNRGISKDNLKDHKGAIEDYTKAIALNPSDAEAYYYRGLSQIALNQKDSGCADLRKASELGSEEAAGLSKQLCK